MQKVKYTILSNELVARDSFRLELQPPLAHSVAIEPGQFVDIAIDELFLRRPISVCDQKSDGRIVLIYKVVGAGTKRLSSKRAGEPIELLLPLGHGFSTEECGQKALLVGGGLGAAPLYLLGKTLLGQGKEVRLVLGFNTAADAVLVDDYRSLGIEPIIATLDGSLGVKGFVTDAIAGYKPDFDFFYSCGPLPMMRALCGSVAQNGEVSMEERMGCGAGFCYGCTIITSKGPRRVCADGPVFDKEDILWK